MEKKKAKNRGMRTMKYADPKIPVKIKATIQMTTNAPTGLANVE